MLDTFASALRLVCALKSYVHDFRRLLLRKRSQAGSEHFSTLVYFGRASIVGVRAKAM